MIAPDDVLREMQWFGLVAVINADFPVDELIEISDALLAAPLPLVAVAAAGAQFVFTTAMDVALTDAAHACAVAIVPLCADAAAFRRALVLRVLPREDVPVLPADRPHGDGAPAVLVGGTVPAANIGRIAQSSAAAVALGYELLAAGHWFAAALIIQARAMRAAREGVRRVTDARAESR